MTRNNETIYVAYNPRGKIVGFSEVAPSTGNFFQIDARRVARLRSKMGKGNYNYLIIRDGIRVSPSWSREPSQEYIALNPTVLQLISEALTDVKSANDDLDSIAQGERTRDRLNAQF